MAFSQATMTGEPSLRASGLDLLVSWVSTSPPGTLFQLYLNAKLAWHGTDRSVLLPYPSGRTRIDVGTVAAGEGAVDFSASLPTTYPPDRVNLTWTGGAFEGADLAGFRIYGPLAAGGAVSYVSPLADIPATVAGVDLSGFGLGGFGLGGFGTAAQSYSWTSDPLLAGSWTFAVVPYDGAGNQNGSPAHVSVTVVAPPRPPAADSSGRRLTYSYNPSTRVPTLNWLASPG